MSVARLLTVVAILVAVIPAMSSADPLHVAAKSGDVERIKQLLAQGQDINVRDENEATPLHWAVYAGHEAAARFLIARGADVYANETQLCLLPLKSDAGKATGQSPVAGEGSATGVTPLHWAASGGYPVVAELLIAEGANVNAETLDGVTPLTVALTLGHIAVAKVLEQHGGRP